MMNSTTTITATTNDVEVVCIPDKSIEDKRQYRVIKLKNQLVCCLVSDPETEKAGASLDVNVGSLSDPVDIPGLAHFLEHMLFLGTSKYPDENSYSSYLNSHGGFSNAFTSMNHTNYYFDVAAHAFVAALDIFAQFFISPLFTATATDREMNAVNNENEKNLQQDNWRLYQLSKSRLDPAHPYSRYATGNIQTLKDEPLKKNINVREALIQFHQKYYSSHVMRLCVVGREDLDTLQQIVVEKFSAIPCSSHEGPRYDLLGSPFAPVLGQSFYIVPVKDLRSLTVNFPLPSIMPEYRMKPTRALAHLLGHEGAGSVFAILKQFGWLLELSAGVGLVQESFSEFGISMQLTPQGLQHVDDIIKVIFSYIELMKRISDQDWKRISKEEADIAFMNFQFKGKESSSQYAVTLASQLHEFEPQHVITGSQLFLSDFNDPEVIAHIRQSLSYLRPDNFYIDIVASDFASIADHKEQWYGTQYSTKPISQELLQSVSHIFQHGASHGNHEWEQAAATLMIPAPNPYIADQFDLVPIPPSTQEEIRMIEEKAVASRHQSATASDVAIPNIYTPGDGHPWAPVPVILSQPEDPTGRCWHVLDTFYRKPKLHASFLIYSNKNMLNTNPTQRVLTDISGQLLTDMLNEFTYDASIAGLEYKVKGTAEGFYLYFYGFHQKISVLIHMVVEQLSKLATTIKQDRFEILREKITRRHKNFVKEQAHQHASFFNDYLLDSEFWSSLDILKVIHHITLDDVKVHIENLLKQTFTECLIHGNIDASAAFNLYQQVQQTLGAKERVLSQELIPTLASLKLQPDHVYYYRLHALNARDNNNATRVFYQIGEDEASLRAQLLLLVHIVNEPCFDQLRTKEQLGYLVFTNLSARNGVLGLNFTVQSSERSADYLEQRIEAFLEKFFEQDLPQMSQEEFKKNVQAVLIQRATRAKTIGSQHLAYWQEIERRRYCFDKVQQELSTYDRLQLSDLLDLYKSFLSISAITETATSSTTTTTSQQRAKLSIQVFSNAFAIPSQPSITMGEKPQELLNPEAKSSKQDDKKDKEQEEDGGDDEEDAEEDGEDDEEEEKTKDKQQDEASLKWPRHDQSKLIFVANEDLLGFRQSLASYPPLWSLEGAKALQHIHHQQQKQQHSSAL